MNGRRQKSLQECLFSLTRDHLHKNQLLLLRTALRELTSEEEWARGFSKDKIFHD
jgi:hypothetical protein